MKNIQFFCDFDGTITKEDTLNKFLRVYAKDLWLEVEEKWLRGDIGSKQCIEEQMQMFPYMKESTLSDFIDSIEIDETFPDFLDYIRSQEIDFCIVSDGFDYFIGRILAKNNIKDVKIFSNKLKLKEGKFETFFPYFSHECERKSGVCKCNVINSNRIVTKRVLYAGDGMSDYCASRLADVLFAKGSLLEYCKNTKSDRENGFALVGFLSFEEIINYIKDF